MKVAIYARYSSDNQRDASGAAQNAKRSPETGDLLLQVQLVAGAGFEPATFGL